MVGFKEELGYFVLHSGNNASAMQNHLLSWVVRKLKYNMFFSAKKFEYKESKYYYPIPKIKVLAFIQRFIIRVYISLTDRNNQVELGFAY